MAKLTRFTLPVFAGSATQTQTSVFGTMKTSPEYTTDVAAAINTQAYSDGWFEAIELGYAPFVEDMNSLQRAITYQISYGQQQGIPEWASDTEYYVGSFAKLNTATGAQVYCSLVDNNVGNLVSDTTKWKLVLDTANTCVTVNTPQTISAEKTFKGDNRVISLQNSTVTYNTAPASNTLTTLSIRDKNDSEMGVFEHVRFANNDTLIRIVAKGIDGNWSSALAVGKKADGNTYTIAPTPSAGDNSQQIATTAFVQTSVNTRTTPSDVSAAISTTLAALYPVGSIYIGTQSTCPLASLISGSQWQLVAQDRALWGGNGSNANTTIAAGLPNITGTATRIAETWAASGETTGAFTKLIGGYVGLATPTGVDASEAGGMSFDASRSSSIYGQSSTVQPPAYRVNVWRRTA